MEKKRICANGNEKKAILISGGKKTLKQMGTLETLTKIHGDCHSEELTI